MPGNGSGASVALNVPTGTTIFTVTAVDANACTISSTISMTSQTSGNLSQASSGNTSSVTEQVLERIHKWMVKPCLTIVVLAI